MLTANLDWDSKLDINVGDLDIVGHRTYVWQNRQDDKGIY